MENPKILLVDDRRENLIALEAVLQSSDLDILLAESGNEALKYFLDHEFALVLLDVQMSDMDGFETAQLIRSREKTYNTPIIFVTAVSTDKHFEYSGYEKGAVDYLPKPINEIILKSKVNIFVDLYRQRKAAEKAYAELKVVTEELQQSNRMILENQKSIVEEERLKLLLQIAGATAQEMTDPLDMILQGLDSLKNHAEQFKDHCAGIMEDLERIREAGVSLRGIVGRIQQIPATGELPATNGFQSLSGRDFAILCIEDDEIFFGLLVQMMKPFPRIVMKHAQTCSAAERILSGESTPNLLLLDHALPDGDSFSIMSFLKRRNLDIPVAIITGQGDEVVASKVIKAGAIDYIPKTEVKRERLFECIQLAIEQSNVKQEMKKAMTVIADMARKDSLTGLYNHRYFLESLQKEVMREARYRTGLSLCMIDIDFFKSINDTFGHTAGDKVLKELAELMEQTMRETDVLCRYGGEEFAIIFTNTMKEGAYKTCIRFRQAVERHIFVHEGFEIRLTISIGLSGYDPESKDSATTFVERTDKELYRAKAEGRNRVCIS
jgi:two-component system, cell cycle response regulator